MLSITNAMGESPRFPIRSRASAAASANAEDADLRRWFSLLMQERRLRWCQTKENWLVSVDHKHVATEATFDEAIRSAKVNSEMAREVKRG